MRHLIAERGGFLGGWSVPGDRVAEELERWLKLAGWRVRQADAPPPLTMEEREISAVVFREFSAHRTP